MNHVSSPVNVWQEVYTLWCHCTFPESTPLQYPLRICNIAQFYFTNSTSNYQLNHSPSPLHCLQPTSTQQHQDNQKYQHNLITILIPPHLISLLFYFFLIAQELVIQQKPNKKFSISSLKSQYQLQFLFLQSADSQFLIRIQPSSPCLILIQIDHISCESSLLTN